MGVKQIYHLIKNGWVKGNTVRLKKLSVEVSRGSEGTREARKEKLLNNNSFSSPASKAYPNRIGVKGFDKNEKGEFVAIPEVPNGTVKTISSVHSGIDSVFGITLSALVLACGLTTVPILNHPSTNTSTRNKLLSLFSSQVAISTPTFKTTELEKSVFEEINRYRASKGLPKLTLNANITRQARIHSQNMAKGKTPFSHQGFERRVKAIPLRYNSAAENVAFNRGYSNPVEEAVTGWLNSPGHLMNLKGNYNLTGIGVATNNQGEVYLTQLFFRAR